MHNKEVVITKEYHDQLIKEYEYLRLVKRKENSENIKEAKTQGDLSENAEYEYARDEQAKTEARISEIENLLGKISIIDNEEIDHNSVNIGTKVRFMFLNSEEIEEYEISGTLEANPTKGRISNESPVGSALMGKKVGDVVTVQSPTGNFKIEILEIKK